MSGDRPTQLSAIVFTDIAGYSRMMEEDEERTIRVLRRHNTIVLPLVERSGGEVIDAIGDGLFILFPSVREAVVCSVAIQEAIGAYNDGAAGDERFRLRIGIHLGEVWREGDRVFGNGVNVAARVQPLAPPGGVCVTEDVYRQVSNKLSHEMRSIGRRELRNISRRMELYQVITGREEAAAQAEPERGELDEIKQRILQERERLSRRHSGDGGSSGGAAEGSFEHRIESKVYNLVERVMDKAVSSWDRLPDEKKSKAVAEIQKEIAKERAPTVRVNVGSDADEDESSKNDDDDPELGSALGVGLAAGVGFGLGYFAFGIPWMIWPFVLIGVVPFLSGVFKAVQILARHERRRRERPAELEHTLLRVAGRLGGTVTVVQAASEAELPLDEVQQTLDRMTAKGYVTQHVRESGIIEYEFPSLGRPDDEAAKREQ
ncbi:MAG: adenylate/guanylate cyclase domain-containing protein [Spirochaetota bacterium]